MNLSRNYVELLSSLCAEVNSKPIKFLLKNKKVCIFGAGNFGRDLCRILTAEGYEVVGFIETNPQSKTVLDYPVLSWSELDSRYLDSQLVIGIFNHRISFKELNLFVSKAGYADFFMPWDVYEQFGKDLGWRFWLGYRHIIFENLARIAKVLSCLADEESKNTIYRVLSFRLGMDIEFSAFRHVQNHYFNELTLPAITGRPIVYVDCGAYSGDTYLELIRKQNMFCEMAFLFEPDPENYKLLVKNVSETCKFALCLPLAVGQEYSILSFCAGNGDGSSISENGNSHIAVASIDQIITNNRIDFLKMDIEGAEIFALRGAAAIIQKSRPVLAISLYHKPEDIWEIPEFVFGLCVDYKFFIRQHCYNSFELVLYAIPIERL